MLPVQFCEKMKNLLGDEFDAFLAALDRPRAVGLRLNPLKVDITQEAPLTSSLLLLTSGKVPWCPTGFYYDPTTRPGLHPFHAAGAYYLQEPSAMAPAELLDPRPGEWVLDLCAAPGGKTTQLAGKLAGRGLLVCNEIHPKRAAVLASNVERMGVANALVLNEHPARLAERFPGAFDRILVDAPCSGEGMFRKHDAAWADWSPETVAMCARRQAEILDSAAGMLRSGGRLVYSTCTFSPEENEGTVAAFLQRHPDFSVERVQTPPFAPGRPDWADGNPALADTFRLWPHKLNGEGHFAAVLRRDAPAGGGVPDAPTPSAADLQGPWRTPAPTNEKAAALPKSVAALLRELGVDLPDGLPVQFGSRVFLAPPGLPELRGLRVLRPGLELAELRRDLAVPAHALALWTRSATSVQALTADDPACAAWLRGETLASAARGWTLVTVDGLGLGWGKGSNGVLKNHYPKGLRITSLQA